jgi:hypothetical protein
VQIRQEMAWLHRTSLGAKIGVEDFLGTKVYFLEASFCGLAGKG